MSPPYREHLLLGERFPKNWHIPGVKERAGRSSSAQSCVCVPPIEASSPVSVAEHPMKSPENTNGFTISV